MQTSALDILPAGPHAWCTGCFDAFFFMVSIDIYGDLCCGIGLDKQAFGSCGHGFCLEYVVNDQNVLVNFLVYNGILS